MNFHRQLVLSTFLITSLSAEKPDPKSLTFSKWTPDFQIPDPVAISFDEQGRAYVTQTQRRKANDLDIRKNRDWIPDDLRFQSADDKRDFYLEKFTPKNSNANKKRVKDYNKDGKHDLADLQFLTERIHLIEDTNGDGLADKTSVYAENFQNEIAGISAGVLHYNGEVYTTIVPDVWKLRDTDDDGKADQRESIAYGFGVHLAYAGHDMHGLTVGPDGKIYWTIGDKGASVKSKEGLHFKYPNQGGVFRCNSDGSNFEVYARGLRNVQEIAFDQYGNLFGVDNDSDRPGEKERFVYIVQHMDAGWRSNWQYRSGEFNPWMDENLSVPYQEKQPAYITPPIGLYNNGPAGLAFNPGTALGEAWKNYFFHTSAPNGQQWAFQVEQDGASFKMVNDMQIGNGVPIVGINFGPDGALYGVDWGGGYPLNKKGAVWKWDAKEKHPLREMTAKMLRSDFSKKDSDELVTTLSHPDQRIRLKAQFELINRGARDKILAATKTGTLLPRIHAIWGLCQLDRTTKNTSGKVLELLNDPDPEIRAQVLRTYSENFGSKLALHQAPEPEAAPFAFEEIEKCLTDKSDRVKFHAAVALANLGASGSEPAILKMARGIKDESNTYLRHAAIVGLTGCASSDFLAKLADDESELVQKIAIVALRRRGDPAVSRFLDSQFEQVIAEAARAIHDDWMIPEAMPALAQTLETSSHLSNKSIILRSINANFRDGSAKSAARVATFATNAKASTELRLNALEALKNWSQPRPLDRVVGRYRPIKSRDAAIAKTALEQSLEKLLTDPDQSIQSKAMSLARSSKIQIAAPTLVAVAENQNSLPELRIEALRSLASQKHPSLDRPLQAALKSNEPSLAIEALTILAKTNQTAALQHVNSLLTGKETKVREQQAALALLGGQLASDEGDKILSRLANRFSLIAPSFQLDLAEAAAKRKIKAPSPDFAHALEGGDAARGENLFMNHIAAQCIRCHKIKDGKGSDIGPNLKSIGMRERGHLLESLLEPQKVISDGYGTISLTLKNGKAIAGLFLRENKNHLEIRDAKGKVQKVKISDIKDRSAVISTMPPMGQILKKREVRDLIEYLSTLKSSKK